MVASLVRSQSCGLCLVVFPGLLPASVELFFLLSGFPWERIPHP